MARSASHANEDQETRAVVMGGSIAGLLAARVLADHVDSVILVERDRLPSESAHRKGVPQSRHAHGVLARGQQILQELFPGIVQELVAAGAVERSTAAQCWVIGGHRLAPTEDEGTMAFSCSRPLLEATVRARVRALPKVQVRDATDVVGYLEESGRVAGIRVVSRADGAAAESLSADLVVDATGRGSRLPTWLDAMGYERPAEERVKIGVQYSSCTVKRKPNDAQGASVVIVAAKPPNPRCAAALAIREDEWIVTLPGYLGASAGRSWEGFVEFARELPSPEIYELLRNTEPTSDIATATYPHSQRRRYEKLRAHPEGIIAIGDSICSFNPIFGQGMTVAACEAVALGELCKTQPLASIWKAFYRRAAPIVDVPWSIAVGNDLRFDEVEGQRTAGGRLLARYLDRFLRLAAHDPVAAKTFLEVTHLLRPPSALMAPRLMSKVFWRPSRVSAGRAVLGSSRP